MIVSYASPVIDPQANMLPESELQRLAAGSPHERMRHAAIHGPFPMLLIMLGNRIYRATRAEVKLH